MEFFILTALPAKQVVMTLQFLATVVSMRRNYRSGRDTGAPDPAAHRHRIAA
jgi:hypothetical protein